MKPMRKLPSLTNFLAVCVASAVGIAVLDAQSAPPQPTASASPTQAAGRPSTRQFLDTYCVTCHNEKRKVGNLAFDSLDVEHLSANAATWERAIKKLSVGAMPPAGMRRPTPEVYAGFIHGLAQQLDREETAAPNPGRPPVHRLNRLQYQNAIRDLFGLEIDGRSMLPADNSGFGFDNIADLLTMSPGLLDRYLVAAAQISRLAIPDKMTRPSVTTYSLPYLTLGQDDRMSELEPFGSRGGTAVSHYFPVDGEYSLTMFMQRTDLAAGSIPRGLDVVSHVDVRLDRARVKLIGIGGVARIPGSSNDAPDVYRGAGGDYDPQAGLQVRFHAPAGTHAIAITFDRDFYETEGLGITSLPLASTAWSQGRLTSPDVGRIEVGLDRVDIGGPLSITPSAAGPEKSDLFVCRPASAKDEEPCARRILRRLAHRAYRRPVTDAEVSALVSFYRRERMTGNFEAGLRAAIQRMLVDINFLFRLEQDPAGVKAGSAYRVSDLELASRLSFFLWSSIPDEELLGLAEKGTLHTPAVLEQQVRRMLADRRADVLLDDFFGQWLTTRNVLSQRPDPKVFPQFDDNLRSAFAEETRLFLADQVRTDRPALEVFTANYTFANERLAKHYGIENVYGSHFRRVALPDDKRGGLFGQGSVLTVTSYADRTSVVMRGKWILETLLGTPPPPPPPNVPPLEATKISGTLRQRMEQHRKNAVCATCHSQLDPPGFALENFDAIGGYRTLDGGAKVDPSGVFVDGTKFAGPDTFRQAMLHYSDALLGNLTEKLLTYALGRGVEYYDMPAVREIIHDTASDQHRWSSLIVAIAKSTPFQLRRAES
jgi:mono/diheme cytochrome c family protein